MVPSLHLTHFATSFLLHFPLNPSVCDESVSVYVPVKSHNMNLFSLFST